MANKIDNVGTYIFKVLDSVLGTTKNGFPQWVARVKAEQKFVENAEEIAHFQKQGLLADGQPGYVDWTSFDEETTIYAVLFKSASDFSKPNQLLNYDQLQAATGWDGTEFDSLVNGTFVGKSILGRVEENEFNGKTTLRVNWIDKADADPNRSLKSVDTNQVKALSALLKNTSGKATPKAAASAPTKPTKASSPPSSAPAVSSAATPAPSTAVPVSAPSAPAVAPTTPKTPKGKKAKAEAPPTEAAAPAGPPAACTKDEAWAYIVEHKGDNEDNVVTDAWISASGEIAGDRDEEALTPADWAKVRDTVLKDLAV